MKNRRSVLYAGVLQFCFPGLGRLYLKNWTIGILQIAHPLILFLMDSVLVVNLRLNMDLYSHLQDMRILIRSYLWINYVMIGWSYLDGYLIMTQKRWIKNDKVDLVYHDLYNGPENGRSPLIAAILQLFWFGSGRIYLGHWMLGVTQLTVFIATNFFGFYLFKYGVVRFVPLVLWSLFDSYFLLKRHQIELKTGLKDRLFASILQLYFPGLGRVYMGHWMLGVLQFFVGGLLALSTSFMLLKKLWSMVDGHHLLLNPDVDKDGRGNLLTNHFVVLDTNKE